MLVAVGGEVNKLFNKDGAVIMDKMLKQFKEAVNKVVSQSEANTRNIINTTEASTTGYSHGYN